MSLFGSMAFVWCFTILFCNSQKQNMNGLYKAANFEDPEFRGEYFEVVSPVIETRYAEVFYTQQDSQLLPEAIRTKFDGKMMAITGIESNFVRIDENGKETFVANWEQYNHHFISTFSSKGASEVNLIEKKAEEMSLYEKSRPRLFQSPVRDDKAANISADPAANFYYYYNYITGNEHRLSWHGLSQGFAHVLNSPWSWQNFPMMINTGVPGKAGQFSESRCDKHWSEPGKNTGLCPQPLATTAREGDRWSGLLECPCTDRKNFEFEIYTMLQYGTCDVPRKSGDAYGLKTITSSDECYKAAIEQGIPPAMISGSTKVVNNMVQPSGCFFVTIGSKVQLFLNTNSNSAGECGQDAKDLRAMKDGQPLRASGNKTSLVDLSIQVDDATDEVTITIAGPSEKWFGVGFGAMRMSDGPYALIVDCSDEHSDTWQVHERRLADHGPGYQLPSILTSTTMKVVDDKRIVTVTRPLSLFNDARYFAFKTDPAILSFINAIGLNPQFGMHQTRRADQILLAADHSVTCLCETTGNPGYIDGVFFGEGCPEWPYSNLLNMSNPSCSLTTYKGGLRCCTHQTVLLDKAQVQPSPVDRFYTKLRVYYEEYTNQRQVFELFYQPSQAHAEFDVIPCKPGTLMKDCALKTEGFFSLYDLGFEEHCDEENAYACLSIQKGIQLTNVKPHGHGPTYINSTFCEVETDDQGKFVSCKPICRFEGIYGHGDVPNNENGYLLGITPCIFGYENGMQKPPTFDLNTQLYYYQFDNATREHRGTMNGLFMKFSYVL